MSDIEIKPIDLIAFEKELSDPNRMQKVADHLSSGGTLIDYCRLVGQSFVDMKKWIAADPERMQAYEDAKKARQEWLFERILAEYRNISSFSLDKIYTPDGALRSISEWDESARAAVAGIESLEVTEDIDGEKVVVGEVKKVKLWDKNKALQDIGKHLKMFAEVIDINHNTTVSIVGALEEADRRLAQARPVVSTVDDEAEIKAEYKDEPI